MAEQKEIIGKVIEIEGQKYSKPIQWQYKEYSNWDWMDFYYYFCFKHLQTKTKNYIGSIATDCIKLSKLDSKEISNDNIKYCMDIFLTDKKIKIHTIPLFVTFVPGLIQRVEGWLATGVEDKEIWEEKDGKYFTTIIEWDKNKRKFFIYGPSEVNKKIWQQHLETEAHKLQQKKLEEELQKEGWNNG